jgi:hypothetical protein
MQQIPKNSRTLNFGSYGQYNGSYGKGDPKKLDISRFKRTPQPPYSPDIAPSDPFLFG